MEGNKQLSHAINKTLKKRTKTKCYFLQNYIALKKN